MINITLNQARLLKSLSLGERFPISNLKGNIFQHLLDEHVLSKYKKGNGWMAFADNPQDLLNHLNNKYIKCPLDDFIQKMEDVEEEINELKRVDNVLMRGNSKCKKTHPMNGFLVKSLDPIDVSLSGNNLLLSPDIWPICFVPNPEGFKIPSDVTIVMVENPENFIHIEKQKEFFKGHRTLFTTYYPRDTHRNLVTWLGSLPNPYIHYGDFDLAGIHIYQHVYRKHISGPSSFFVPEFIDKLIHRFGETELYNKQLPYRDSILPNEPGIKRLLDIIDREHKGLEQEIFNSEEYKKYLE